MKYNATLSLLLLSVSLSSCEQDNKPQEPTPTTLFLGVWSADTTDNAEFIVNRNSLTYAEFSNRPVKYTITPTTLTIFNEDGPYVGRIKKLTEDSLVYTTPGGFVARLYKRR